MAEETRPLRQTMAGRASSGTGQRPKRPDLARKIGGKRPASAATGKPIGRWIPAIAALTVLAVVVAAGTGGDDKPSLADAAGAVDVTSTTIAAAITPEVTQLAAPDGTANGYDVTGLTVPATTLPAVEMDGAAPVVTTHLANTLRQGSFGDDVKALQDRLTALGFVPGVSDGAFGQQTKEAVWAFEKLILSTPYDQATGKVTDDMWQLMQQPIDIRPYRPGNGTHVEIYLPKQVAAVFTDNKPTRIIHISSGTAFTRDRTPENEWCETVHLDTDDDGNSLAEPIAKDVCGVSYTPGGVFTFKRQVSGDRVGALGRMFNPIYFNYGIAMHGAKEVPLHPASHGCIRMNQRISDTFQTYVHLHDRVYVWGWDGKEPEQYTKNERLPVFNYDDPNSTTTTTEKATTTSTKSTTKTTEKVSQTTPTTEKPTPTTQKPTPTTATPTTPATTAAPATTAPATQPPTTPATSVPVVGNSSP